MRLWEDFPKVGVPGPRKVSSRVTEALQRPIFIQTREWIKTTDPIQSYTQYFAFGPAFWTSGTETHQQLSFKTVSPGLIRSQPLCSDHSLNNPLCSITCSAALRHPFLETFESENVPPARLWKSPQKVCAQLYVWAMETWNCKLVMGSNAFVWPCEVFTELGPYSRRKKGTKLKG